MRIPSGTSDARTEAGYREHVVHKSYLGALESLRSAAADASDAQRELAVLVGCELPAAVPRIVASALLRDHLEHVIEGREDSGTQPATDAQVKYLEALAPERSSSGVRSARVVSAWIDYFLTLRSIACHQELELEAGDRVARLHRWTDPIDGELHEYEDTMVVSSIGDDGLVYFRGGNGQCAHPHRLRRLS